MREEFLEIYIYSIKSLNLKEFVIELQIYLVTLTNINSNGKHSVELSLNYLFQCVSEINFVLESIIVLKFYSSIQQEK